MWKKVILTGIVAVSALFGGELIKNNTGFIGIAGGGAKVTEKWHGLYSFKVGYYYYISNPLKVSNRLYLSVDGIAGVKEGVNEVGLHFDGIFNYSPIFKPYAGVVVADAIRYQNGDDVPKNFLTYGGEVGLILPLGNHWEVEAGGRLVNATKSISWKRSLKEYFIGFNYSF
jgi:hypothetical protein